MDNEIRQQSSNLMSCTKMKSFECKNGTECGTNLYHVLSLTVARSNLAQSGPVV